MRVIGKKARLKYQLIRYYFGSKELLWEATLDHLLKQHHHALSAIQFDAAKGDLDDQVRYWIRIALSLSIEEPQIFRLLVREYYAESKNVSRSVRSITRKFRKAYMAIFDGMYYVCGLQRFRPEQMAIIVNSMCLANTVMPKEVAQIISRSTSARELIDHQVDLTFSILKYGYGQKS